MSSQNERIPEIDLMQEGLEHLGDLVCEISRGNENECPGAVDLRVRLQLVDDGQQVGEGLARACLVTDHHVLSLHDQRDRLLLDWCRVAKLVDHEIEV